MATPHKPLNRDVPTPPTADDRLDAIGIAEIAGRIVSGETQREIAADLGVNQATLSIWLSGANRSARTRAAMLEAAEALQDRGHQALMDARGGSQADVALARALDQHWARRAAIRNPAHRERTDHVISGQVGHTVQALSRAQLLEIAAQGLPDAPQVAELLLDAHTGAYAALDAAPGS